MVKRATNAVVATYGGPLNVDIKYKRTWLDRKGVLCSDHLPNFGTGKLAGITLSVDSVDDIRMIFEEIDESEDQIVLIQNGSELVRALERNQFAVVLCASYLAVGSDPSQIPFLRSLGIRLLSFSTNRRNYLADGCGERNASGLSHLGLDVLREMDRLQVLPDVSHLSDQAFWDVVEHTDQPVIATHSNARTLCDSARNLSDDQLKAVAQTDGLIGISTYPTLVAQEDAGLEQLLDHIDYLVQKAGIAHVAIGTDFVSFMGSLFDAKLAQADPGGKLYKDMGTSTQTRDIGRFQEVSNLVEGLLARGYTGKDLEMILNGNYCRVLRCD